MPLAVSWIRWATGSLSDGDSRRDEAGACRHGAVRYSHGHDQVAYAALSTKPKPTARSCPLGSGAVSAVSLYPMLSYLLFGRAGWVRIDVQEISGTQERAHRSTAWISAILLHCALETRGLVFEKGFCVEIRNGRPLLKETGRPGAGCQCVLRTSLSESINVVALFRNPAAVHSLPSAHDTFKVFDGNRPCGRAAGTGL